ncbi:hypothetical protein M0804_013286 [Polistes exclamans]|nr:hypothetical protein M0804_013286 [Polistes exclamans]
MSSETDDEMKKYLTDATKVLGNYNPNKYLFSSWKSKFLKVVTDLKVPDNRKSEFLCLMLSKVTLRKLKQHFHPRDPKDLPFDEVVAGLVSRSSRDAIAYNRHKFKTLKQNAGETIQEYAKHLQKLHKKSKFTLNLDARLCTTFLNGLTDRVISNYLKRKKNITFNMAVQKAIELERKAGPSTSSQAQ